MDEGRRQWEEQNGTWRTRGKQRGKVLEEGNVQCTERGQRVLKMKVQSWNEETREIRRRWMKWDERVTGSKCNGDVMQGVIAVDLALSTLFAPTTPLLRWQWSQLVLDGNNFLSAKVRIIWENGAERGQITEISSLINFGSRGLTRTSAYATLPYRCRVIYIPTRVFLDSSSALAGFEPLPDREIVLQSTTLMEIISVSAGCGPTNFLMMLWPCIYFHSGHGHNHAESQRHQCDIFEARSDIPSCSVLIRCAPHFFHAGRRTSNLGNLDDPGTPHAPSLFGYLALMASSRLRSEVVARHIYKAIGPDCPEVWGNPTLLAKEMFPDVFGKRTDLEELAKLREERPSLFRTAAPSTRLATVHPVSSRVFEFRLLGGGLEDTDMKSNYLICETLVVTSPQFGPQYSGKRWPRRVKLAVH
ncbi:hypothetical protein DFH09DRAFT_1107747 [Mycena vulgaris]|nr:hypothetical protein DFH09DRAFT_1107747 [Mycena vulgaris]